MSRYSVVSGRSTILVSARSSMGPIVFETSDVEGWVEADASGDAIATDPGPSASIQIAMKTLRSGNEVYDAELRRRLDTRRHPRCTLDLVHVAATATARFALRGEITFHDITRPINGTVDVERVGSRGLLVTGEKLIDIRDFAIPAPGILMLKIYPEVDVRMFIEVVSDEQDVDA